LLYIAISVGRQINLTRCTEWQTSISDVQNCFVSPILFDECVQPEADLGMFSMFGLTA